ncbi:MAG: polysaccharide deacetylase family protein [Gaiellaceae bacterium]
MTARLGPLVLCYHAVTSEWPDPLAVSAADLERQLRLLRRFWPAGSAADAAGGRRVLHVTFDDAYRNVGDALPVLERLRVPATVFVCAGYLDGRPLDIPELRGTRFDATALATMTVDELRELRERGVEIGSHTLVHPHLPALGDAELRRELVESRQVLEEALGVPCRLLAYPFGEQDARVRAAARAAGYEAAFGLPGERDDRYALPRLGVWRRDSLRRVAAKAAVKPFVVSVGG